MASPLHSSICFALLAHFHSDTNRIWHLVLDPLEEFSSQRSHTFRHLLLLRLPYCFSFDFRNSNTRAVFSILLYHGFLWEAATVPIIYKKSNSFFPLLKNFFSKHRFRCFLSQNSRKICPIPTPSRVPMASPKAPQITPGAMRSGRSAALATGAMKGGP